MNIVPNDIIKMQETIEIQQKEIDQLKKKIKYIFENGSNYNIPKEIFE